MAKKQKKGSLQAILDEIPKRWIDLFKSRIDARSEEEKNIWKTIRNYVKKDRKKLGLLQNLMIYFDGQPLNRLLNVEPFDYQRDVEGATCLCGEDLSKKVYIIEVGGRAVHDGKESQIGIKIREKIPLINLDLKSHGLFPLGSTCYKRFNKILSDFGLNDIEEKKKKSRKEKEKELKEAEVGISDELKEILGQFNIDAEQFKKLRYYLEDASDFEDKNLLYALDPGKKKSFSNWFRERAKKNIIKDDKILDIYERLNKAPRSLTTKDLGALVTYSYEFREYDTKLVIGGVKDDLLYLDSLADDDLLIKRFGRVNLDKHYVRPATRFRKRENLKKQSIRDKLEDPKMTFLEGLGILMHFSDIKDRKTGKTIDISEVRRQANMETAHKYGVGRSWDYILKEMRPVFEDVKEELAKEYNKFGEIVKEHVLTRDEYLICKRFFERSEMGFRRTERENYLRMFSVREFRETAPKIIAIGRKIRYARKKYDKTGDEELKEDTVRRDYILKEELKDKFEELTELKENPDKVIDVIVNTGFVKSKSARYFIERNSDEIRDMYDHGLLARNYLRKGKSGECALKRHYNNIRWEGIIKIDDATKEKLVEIADFLDNDFVLYFGPVSAAKMREIKYTTRNGKMKIDRMHSDIRRLKDKIRYDSVDRKRFEENREFLEQKGNVLYLDDGEHSAFASEAGYCSAYMVRSADEPFTFRRRDNEYKVSAYDIGRMQEAVDRIKKGVEVDEEFLEKLRKLSNDDLKAAGSNEYLNLYHLQNEEYDRVVVSKRLKEKIDKVYAQLR